MAVSNHALDRHLERFPGEPQGHEARRFQIASTVSAALSEGRYATREPRWLRDGARRTGLMNGRERDRSLRWCWDAAQRQVFLVDRQGNAVVVVTSIRADS